MNFKEWKNEVDNRLQAIYGLGGDDLADAHYYDHYERGTEPEDMARIVVIEQYLGKINLMDWSNLKFSVE